MILRSTPTQMDFLIIISFPKTPQQTTSNNKRWSPSVGSERKFQDKNERKGSQILFLTFCSGKGKEKKLRMKNIFWWRNVDPGQQVPKENSNTSKRKETQILSFDPYQWWMKKESREWKDIPMIWYLLNLTILTIDIKG